ncbi:MAG TPA: hypothetical protein VNH83_04615 [Bryobacteraceae bacterium]|nr:hypothetical protein [Bryobacteraceae bacterium]
MTRLSPTWLFFALVVGLSCCTHDGGKRSVFEEFKAAVERYKVAQAGMLTEAKTK